MKNLTNSGTGRRTFSERFIAAVEKHQGQRDPDVRVAIRGALTVIAMGHGQSSTSNIK